MTHYYLHFNFFHKFFYCKWRIWCKFLASSSGIVVWYTWKSWHTYLSYFLAYFLSYLSGRLSWYTYLSYILPYFSAILYWYTMYLSVILLQYFSDTLYVMLFWQLHVIPIWHTVLVYVSVILLLFFFWHTLLAYWYVIFSGIFSGALLWKLVISFCFFSTNCYWNQQM